MQTLLMMTAALVMAVSAATAEPVKLTAQQLDQVVAGFSGCEAECIPQGFHANNGWGNGWDPGNPGSDNGKTAPSKSANGNVPAGGKININPTTSNGR